MASFNFSVVPRGKGLNELVPDTEVKTRLFKHRDSISPIRVQPVCKLGSVVCLNALDLVRELFSAVLEEHCGRISAVFFKCFKVTETRVFIDKGVLLELFPLGIADKTRRRHEFDVDLYSLPGIEHFLIGLGDVLGVWKLHCHLAAPDQNTIKSGYRPCIASLPEFDPQHHDSSVGIPSPHISDQRQLLIGMLVRVMIRPV